MASALKHYRVICRGPKRRVSIAVTAEYFRMVDGALVFRNYVPNNYPETVRLFAPGYWLEVVPSGR